MQAGLALTVSRFTAAQVGQHPDCQANTDLPNWTDIYNRPCSVYDSTLCSTDGNTGGKEPDFKYITANEACIVCGACDSCQDSSGFLDKWGDGCDVYEDDEYFDYVYDDDSYYGESWCSSFGHTLNTDALPVSALDACCVCGGGDRQEATNVFDAELLLDNSVTTTQPDAPVIAAPTDAPVTTTPTDLSLPLKTTDSQVSASYAPTKSPTFSPTFSPTNVPTRSPTMSPTESPTAEPTESPTAAPSKNPTKLPTSRPTESPTATPSKNPTKSPTPRPTESPTLQSLTSSPLMKPEPIGEIDEDTTSFKGRPMKGQRVKKGKEEKGGDTESDQSVEVMTEIVVEDVSNIVMEEVSEKVGKSERSGKGGDTMTDLSEEVMTETVVEDASNSAMNTVTKGRNIGRRGKRGATKSLEMSKEVVTEIVVEDASNIAMEDVPRKRRKGGGRPKRGSEEVDEIVVEDASNLILEEVSQKANLRGKKSGKADKIMLLLGFEEDDSDGDR
eukprot:scaffold10529_cov62-Attheya_sp.AAC.3